MSEYVSEIANKVVALYRLGERSGVIARRLKIHKSTVVPIARRHNLPIQKRGRPATKKEMAA